MGRTVTTVIAVVATALALLPASAARADDPVDIWFPVASPYEYSDTWGASRSGGRTHEGTDIMADQMRRVIAANSGVIKKAQGEDCRRGEHCSSYYLLVNGDDGHSYFYVHLNNDTPGRPDGCDGKGGADNAFSPRLVDVLRERGTLEGVRVERGEHIAYVGSSGNAGCNAPHLHFEIWHGHDWDSPKMNPYRSLRQAEEAGRVSNGDHSGDEDDDDAGRQAERSGPPPPGPHGRVAGSNRLLTAVALSRHAFGAADTVVVAPGNHHQEPLVGGPLAALHDGPLLLAWGEEQHGSDALPDAVADEVRRLGATSAILVGSVDRLTPAVEQQLVAKAGLSPANIRRVGGASPYGVAANVAEEITTATGPGASPLVALGQHEVASRSWPDALGASVVAATERVPVLLTAPGQLPRPIREFLRDADLGQVRLVGGEGAIKPAVETEVRNLGHATKRLAGTTRYGTSVALTDELLRGGGADGSRVYLATGHNFPDAVASGPSVARHGGVLLMADGRDQRQADEIWHWLRDHAQTVESSIAVGGKPVVADGVLRKAASYGDWPR